MRLEVTHFCQESGTSKRMTIYGISLGTYYDTHDLSCCRCAHLEQSSAICNSVAISADFSQQIEN